MHGRIRYHDLRRYWTKRIMPHLQDKKINDILVRDFNNYTTGLWGKPFKRGMYPEDVENCDWRPDHLGREPRFWKYVKHAACHWIVNFSLRLAMLAEPKRQWRILRSDKHSTVWDGRFTLFDFNYQALGITAQECYEAVKDGQHLPPGVYIKANRPPPYTLESRLSR